MPSPDSIADNHQSTSTVSPFALEPELVERIWGVRDLAPWYQGPVHSGPVGEIWLTAENCKSAAGSSAGETLAKIVSTSPERFGDDAGEGFPLLIKLLFPREKLSVQVHPNDEQARVQGMPRGKTECWYVLSAEPGAQIALGFNKPLSQTEVRAAIEDGTIEAKLRMIPVKRGDMVFVDAGTVHAIGPGMVVLETQQYSDTTYRLWDYGRPRELHVEAGAAVTRTDTAAGLVAPVAMDGFTRLVSCEYFAVDRFRLSSEAHVPLGNTGKLQILIALSGEVHVSTEQGEALALPHAQAVILPAAEAAYELHASNDAEIIRVLKP